MFRATRGSDHWFMLIPVVVLSVLGIVDYLRLPTTTLAGSFRARDPTTKSHDQPTHHELDSNTSGYGLFSARILDGRIRYDASYCDDVSADDCERMVDPSPSSSTSINAANK